MTARLSPKMAAVYRVALRKERIGLEDALAVCGADVFARRILDDLVASGHLVRSRAGGFVAVRELAIDIEPKEAGEEENVCRS